MTKIVALRTAVVGLLLVTNLASAADLKVLRVTPTGVDVPTGQQIVISFNQAVVPLGRMERKPEEVPITITPELACEWRWLDTQALACQLSQAHALRPATRYRVEIRPEFRTEAGALLQDGLAHEFVTQRPQLQWTAFADWEGPAQPVVRAHFNQPVTAASVAASLSFSGTPATVGPDLYDNQMPFFTPEGEARRAWTLRPQQPLALDRKIELLIAPGLRSALGPEPGAEKRAALDFRTYPEFRFLGAACASVRTRESKDWNAGAPQPEDCSPLDGVTLRFSAPVAPAALGRILKLSPDPLAGRDFKPWVDAEEKVYLARGAEASFSVPVPIVLGAAAEYRFSADAGLKDGFGRTLAKGFEISVRTGHRPPAMNFEHQNAVLEQGLDSQVPIYVTNLRELRAKFARLTTQGLETAQKATVPIPAVNDLSFALPLPVREFLGGATGAVRGELDSDPKIPDVETRQTFFAVVSRWQLQVKLGHYNTLVWVTDFASGQPVADAAVQIFMPEAKDKSGLAAKADTLREARTNAEGIALLPGAAELDPELKNLGYRPDTPWLVKVTKDRDLALLPLSYEFEVAAGSVSSYQVSSWQRPRYAHLKSWGTTAQGVYRAGDTVQYKVYVRNDDKTALAPAPSGPYSLQVFDPTDQLVHERSQVTLSSFGALDGEFKLAPSASVGWYRFALKPGFTKDSELAPLRVLVSDFTPAPFKIATELRAAEVKAGQSVIAITRASLHAGGALAGAPARLSARLHATPFQPKPALAGQFQFDSYDREAREQQPLLDNRGRLDPQGELSSELKAPESTIAYGRIEVEGSAQDDRGRSVAGSASISYFGRDRLIGLRYHGWLLRQGEAAAVDTLVVNLQGEPASGAPTYVKVERMETAAARVRGAGNAYLPRYSHRWKAIAICKGRSQDAPQSCAFTPDEAGSYRVTAMLRDSQNRLHSTRLWLYAAGRTEVLWEESPDYTLELMPSSREYRVGDTAKFFVKNPFPGARALVTVERYGVIESRVQVLTGSTPVIEVPVKPDHLPGFYLSVTVMSPRVETPPKETGQGTLDLGKPTFRMGYQRVSVVDPYKDIAVGIKPERETYKPRETVKVKVEAKPRNANGEPLELAVAVLDEAVFDLIQGGMSYFDPAQGLRGLDDLDLANYSLLTRLVGRQKFEKKGANPGGDGGAGLALRSIEKFVAYWNPALAVDAKGQAQFEFKLPDNLGAWRIVAMALTPSDRMGAGHGAIKVSKETELRPVMPNQVTEGDSFQAGFSVMNRAAKTRTFTVHVEAGAQKHEESLTLKSFERRVLYLPVTASAPGQLSFTATAGDKQDQDGLRHVVPVKPRRPTVTAAEAGSLTAGSTTQNLAIPPAILGGELSVQFSATVLGGLDEVFGYLRDYPYQCWEQRISRAVMAAHALKLKPYLGEDFEWPGADTLPQQVLDEAASFQAPAGGMAFWLPQDAHQSPYLSAYTALTFVWLKELGYQVPAAVSDKLNLYLQRLLREDIAGSDAESRAAVRSITLAALAAQGKAKLADLRRFAPALPRMSLFGEALFLQTAQRLGDEALAQSARERILARGQESAGTLVLRETADDWSALLGSEQRGNCAALSAFVGQTGDAGETPMKLTRSVGQALSGRGHWSNTQENVFCGRALLDYAQRYESTPPDLKLQARLDDKPLGQATLKSRDACERIALPLTAGDAGRKAALNLSAEGAGRAYFATRLRYTEPESQQQAANAGLELKRRYFVREGQGWKEVQPPLQLTRGDMLKIELELGSPASRSFVVVDDAVPGGLEPVNPDLATASGLGAEDLESDSGWFYHRELRHDAARFYADHLPAGRYTLRWIGQAVAAGEFAVGAAHAEEMYDPDVFGNTAPARLTVKDVAP
jgi:hypothetical protein